MHELERMCECEVETKGLLQQWKEQAARTHLMKANSGGMVPDGAGGAMHHLRPVGGAVDVQVIVGGVWVVLVPGEWSGAAHLLPCDDGALRRITSCCCCAVQQHSHARDKGEDEGGGVYGWLLLVVFLAVEAP